MIILCLVAMVTFINGLVFMCCAFDTFSKTRLKYIVLVIISSVISIFSFYAMGRLLIELEKASYVFEGNLESSIDIYALSDSSQISGQIYYRRGYISEQEYIQFVVGNSYGGKEIRKVKAVNASFYETNDYTPRIDTYIAKKKVTFLCFSHKEEMTFYRFYVPEDSITSEFEVDLE